MRVALTASAIAFWIALSARAQSPTPAATPAGGHHARPSDEVFRVQPLGNGVSALFGRGGNIGFFVGPDSVIVVDSQFRDLAPGIVEQIRKVTEKPIRFLINTHHHGDHVGGNEVFRQFAMILAQDNVRTRMLASPQTIQRDYPAMLEEARKSGNAEMTKFFADQIEWARTVRIEEIPAPTLTFDSEFRIYPGNGETIQIWHLPPAHTDGDSVVYFEKANVLHMGDDLFNGVIPLIDVKGGGSVRGYLTALDQVASRVPANVVIIPGHGEVTDLAGLKAFRQYIVDLLDAAAKAKAAGKSKEAFVQEVDLPAYKAYRGYPNRFRENAAAAYDETR